MSTQEQPDRCTGLCEALAECEKVMNMYRKLSPERYMGAQMVAAAIKVRLGIPNEIFKAATKITDAEIEEKIIRPLRARLPKGRKTQGSES